MSTNQVAVAPTAAQREPVPNQSLSALMRDLIPARARITCRRCDSQTSLKLRDEIRRMQPEAWDRVTQLSHALAKLPAAEAQQAGETQALTNEIQALKDETQALKNDIAERDAEILKRVRQAARSQNEASAVRKKVEAINRDVDAIVETARDDLVRMMLPVLDAIDNAVKHAEATDGIDGAQLTGLHMLQRSADSALANAGYAPQHVLHQPFDADLHASVSAVETTDVAPDTIVEEVRRGYVNAKSEQPVRHAEVTVAVAPDAAKGAYPTQSST